MKLLIKRNVPSDYNVFSASCFKFKDQDFFDSLTFSKILHPEFIAPVLFSMSQTKTAFSKMDLFSENII